MIDVARFYNLLRSQGINFFSGVPDSLLKNICAYITDNSINGEHIIAANEGNALSLGIGYYLATGNLPLIYMQNSGLGNVVNPLISLADPDVYSVPMLLMVGWRGEPGIKDEPQHKKQGRITRELLDAMEVPYTVLDSSMSDEDVKVAITESVNTCKKNNSAHVMLVRKEAFSEYKLKDEVKNNYPLTREDAIKIIVDTLESSDIVVSTTGVTSRELYEYREVLSQGHAKDFLTVGGMGHADQIALGIALHKKDRRVFCLDGDGATLMHMGTLAVNASMGCNNFTHIVFNNGVHDSVGAQPTVAAGLSLSEIARECGYNYVFSAESQEEIVKILAECRDISGSKFIELRVRKGFRTNLSRPKESPQENKKLFMEFLYD